MSAAQQNTRDLVESNGRQTATFRFPAAWDAWKYDDEVDPKNRFYQSHVKRAAAVSAVDFVAYDLQADALLMIECKDIRGATADNLPRLSDSPSPDEGQVNAFIKKSNLAVKVDRAKPYLPREFAKNIRDTLVGLIGATRANDPALEKLVRPVIAGKKLVCVLSFEMDALAHWQPGEGGRLLSTLKKAIEREVSFLQNVEVIICSGLNRVAPHSYNWQILVSP